MYHYPDPAAVIQTADALRSAVVGAALSSVSSPFPMDVRRALLHGAGSAPSLGIVAAGDGRGST